MPVIVQNFRCSQVPELKIVGICNTPVKHFPHATQIIGLLTGKSSRAASTALQNFIRDSEEPKMRIGGDLATEYQNGSMDAMIYTHYMHKGTHPSYFFTVEGVEETLRSLPNQVEDMRQKFRELFDAYRASASSTFNLDTSGEDQSVDDEDAGEGQELDIIPKNIDRDWCYRFALQTERQKASVILDAEKEKSELKLQMKDAKLEVKDAEMKAKIAEMETAAAKHATEKAQWELKCLQDKTRMRETHRRDEDQHRTESDEEGPMAARKTDKLRKLKSKLSYFARMSTSDWDNELPGVNFFVELPDDGPVVEEFDDVPPPVCPADKLIVRMVNGHEKPDSKQFIMALFYKGKRTSKLALIDSFMIKEAYGVESDGLQFLCLILYVNNGRRMKDIASVLYNNGILPHNVTPEPIPGSDEPHHISVFRVSAVTNDPVLTMLKKPSLTKWKWFNTKWGN